MVKPTKLPYTVLKRSHGRLTWYYRRGPRWVKLPGDPGKNETAARLYWECRTGKHTAPRGDTVADLIASYKLTPRFLRLKPSSRKIYDFRLSYIAHSAGGVLVATLARSDVIGARDANADRPGAANQILAVLSALMEHAIDLGWRKDNPAHGVEQLPGGDGYEPWTEAQIARFTATATGPARTAFELCLGTGQRIGDVLRMAWDDLEDMADPDTGEATRGINVVQEKTGAALWVPLTPRLSAYLGTLQRGLRTTIITRRDGAPLTYAGIRRVFLAARDAADCGACTLHGLRKNATVELIEAGCSDAEVMAITGHSGSDMVRLYSKRAKQRKLAMRARTRGQK